MTESMPSRIVSTAESLAAVRRAVRGEILRQAHLGVSVPIWRNDQVVWLTPEEILARDAEIQSRKTSE